MREVLLPEAEMEFRVKDQLSPRPASLEGKVLGILQNTGATGLGEGELHTEYPYEPIVEELAKRYKLANVVWYAKPMLSMVAPKAQMDEITSKADVIITGMCQ